MKLYAPRYYKNFRCIADRCAHSCCIGWEIDVDAAALERYEGLTDGYGAIVRESISTEGTPHFRLCEGDRCPHLDGKGLCRIITDLGEDYLCDICKNHPRFYNYTDVAEVGVGMSCEAAARLILSSPDYALFDEAGEVEADADGVEFDGRAERSDVYALLQDGTREYTERLDGIYRRYAIDKGDDGRWLCILDSMEYLEPSHRSLFMKYSSRNRPKGMDIYLERALAYFIYRHCSEAFDREDFIARLSFCLFCERLLASLMLSKGGNTLDAASELARIISEEIEYSDDNTLALTY